MTVLQGSAVHVRGHQTCGFVEGFFVGASGVNLEDRTTVCHCAYTAARSVCLLLQYLGGFVSSRNTGSPLYLQLTFPRRPPLISF
jgi:hypothetical protein